MFSCCRTVCSLLRIRHAISPPQRSKPGSSACVCLNWLKLLLLQDDKPGFGRKNNVIRQLEAYFSEKYTQDDRHELVSFRMLSLLILLWQFWVHLGQPTHLVHLLSVLGKIIFLRTDSKWTICPMFATCVCSSSIYANTSHVAKPETRRPSWQSRHMGSRKLKKTMKDAKRNKRGLSLNASHKTDNNLALSAFRPLYKFTFHFTIILWFMAFQSPNSAK